MVFFIGVDGNWKFICILKREEQGNTHTHILPTNSIHLGAEAGTVKVGRGFCTHRG
jgi:hypothetical protein